MLFGVRRLPGSKDPKRCRGAALQKSSTAVGGRRNGESGTTMHVVVNRLAALGQKTGIGHYTTQLLRCLQEQAPPGVIDEFPRGWVGRLRETAAAARPRL